MLPTFDIPPIGPKQGKVWGNTQLVFARNDVEAHAIVVNRGGYCSRHKHWSKWNRFIVLCGKLVVRTFEQGESKFMEDETTLTAGQITDVPPGTLHEFQALEDCVAIEMYWVELDPRDIERQTVGGIADG